jgi:cellulose synthase/poly-beta-1,6-N-acetylglucosamine synthase-like glycosyltransferase
MGQNILPLVSVIVPAYNEEKVIGACLDSLVALDYPRERLEIIVVDDGSTDRTAEIISKYRSVNAIKGAHQGPSAARNLALRQAKGEYVAFTDADCVVRPDWLRQLLRGFMAERVAGVGGIQAAAKDESAFGLAVGRVLGAFGFIAAYSRVLKAPADVDHNASCNVLYKKSALDQVGGFDEALWPGEDVDLDHKLSKAGFRLRQDPAVAVEHYRPSTLPQYRNMMYRYGLVQAYLVKKYGIFRAIQIIPFAVPLVFLTAIAIGAVFKIAGLLVLSISGVALFGSLVLRGRLTGPRDIFLTLLAPYDWHRGFYAGILKR